jgi:hypothetical protein
MEQFNKKIQEQFDIISKSNKLFKSSLTGQQVWDLYLNSFTKKENPTFRDPNSSTYECNHCKNFIRRYGNIVSIDENYNIVTMFDVKGECDKSRVARIIDLELKKHPINNVFVETFDNLKMLPYESCKKSNTNFKLGTAKNHKIYTPEEAVKYPNTVEVGKVYTFHHFNLTVPKSLINFSGNSVESIQGDFKSSKDVWKRGLEEISLSTLNLTLDLINQGSLLNGTSHAHKIKEVIPFKKSYDKLGNIQKDNFSWLTSYKFAYSRFKNELIGVLCHEIDSTGDLNKACLNWNKRVDPANYMRATAPITQKQIDNFKKFSKENGYNESFDRRPATLDDIKVTDINHVNRDGENSSIKEVSIFDNLKPTTSNKNNLKQFDKVEEVSVDKFLSDILPQCESVEALLENKHENNLVTLTTSKNNSGKNIFKWDNNYSWTYNGNLAGKSLIKDSVKQQGGKVDGVLRFSIMWSEKDSVDNSDLDAHCIEPSGNTIYYSSPSSRLTGGNLDIDITNPSNHKRGKNKDVVENITYPSIVKMKDGNYQFLVHQFSANNSKGFKAEIEFDGKIYSYEYNKPVKKSAKISVATVSLKDSKFTIKHHIEPQCADKEIYNLKTNNFHKVNLVCLSPNHWGDNNTGNKHYFFFLDKCINNEDIRTVHNENLNSDILQYRKVTEVVGQLTKTSPIENQLSGIGFNSTIPETLTVKLKGNFNRVLKIKF